MKKIFEKAFGRMSITILLILLQVVWFAVIVLKLEQYSTFVTGLTTLLASILVVAIAGKWDNPAYKLAWTIVILVFPIVGVSLYFFFGHNSVDKRVAKRFEMNDKRFMKLLPDCSEEIQEVRDDDRQIGNICRYISNIAGYPIYKNSGLKYHALADDGIADLKARLKEAKEFIFMEYFIIAAGESAFEEIVDILVEKVKEGVEVRLLYDDVGSVAYFNGKDFKRLRSLGINIRTFNKVMPVMVAFHNNRDHRKITVIDGKVAFTGGYNLADEYVNKNCPYGHWKDTGIMCTGECVDSFTAMFLSMWNSVAREDADYSVYFNRYDKPAVSDYNGFIQPYADTPLDHERVGEDVYLNIIKTACDYVYIYTPYLIIDNEMMNELCLAAKSGVDVRIITPGIPDKKIIFLLTQSYYEQLLSAGVRIYEYTPGFIHAKAYICDDNIATVGTINMDYRSLFLHFECGTFMYKCDAIKDVKKDFEETMSVCTEITPEMARKNIFIRWFQNFLKLLAPMV